MPTTGTQQQDVSSDGAVMRDFYCPHDPVNLECDPAEDMCRQEFASECDINVLLRHYQTVGGVPPAAVGQEYFDTTMVPTDLAEAIREYERAEAAFMRLPPDLRRELGDDPVRFVEFAGDPANLDVMRKHGLAPPAAPVPQPSAETAPAGSAVAPKAQA